MTLTNPRHFRAVALGVAAATAAACTPADQARGGAPIAPPSAFAGTAPSDGDRLRSLPTFDAFATLTPRTGVEQALTRKLTGANHPGKLASVDARRGLPTMLMTPRVPIPTALSGADTEFIASHFLERYAPVYDLDRKALATVEPHIVHDNGAGPALVQYRQRIGGVEVWRERMSILLDRNKSLVAITGNLSPVAAPVFDASALVGEFALGAQTAAALAVEDLLATDVGASSLALTGEPATVAPAFDLARYETFAALEPFAAKSGKSFQLASDLRARRVYYRMADELIAAYYVEVDVAETGSNSPYLWGYVMAADNGRVLHRESLTKSESYQYTLWAETSGPDQFRPFDGPIQDSVPHPDGTNSGYVPEFVPPVALTVDGLNDNGSGSDPWLPAGATNLRETGNNVSAYADHDTVDGYQDGTDVDAVPSAPGEFNYVYDTSLAPLANDTQIQASIVSLFYVNNWLHDIFYDAGFNEQAGNAQRDNFGRGGVGGDPLRAEAQDTAGAQLNNANMSTPADGTSPRMQMYMWNGEILPDGETFVDITAPVGIAQKITGSPASFGQPGELLTATGLVVEIVDDTDPASDGCENVTNGAELEGKIVLIDRGTCAFTVKVANAQSAGAIGVIIASQQDNPIPGTLGGSDPTITIPAVGIEFEQGAVIRAELANNVTVEVSRAGSTESTRRDGTIDNSIVAHEFGHYYHMRQVACGNNQCGGMSEGFGDFMSLLMALREGDDLEGTYSVAPYATFTNSPANSSYFGVRRYAYSQNPERNKLTFRHADSSQELPADVPFRPNGAPNSQVHASGEVWCSHLWAAYTGLVAETRTEGARYDFYEARARMTLYLTLGMQGAPANPTFTEQRDAILAAALANDQEDFEILAAGFASRGMGAGAVSPPRFSDDHVGIVESFSTAGALAFGNVTFTEDTDESCDFDGVVDASEVGTLAVEVLNGGFDSLADTTVSVASALPGVTIEGGGEATVETLDIFGNAIVTFEVALAPEFTGRDLIFDLELANEAAVLPSETVSLPFRVNFDDVPSTLDPADAFSTTLAADDLTGGSASWNRIEDGANFVWNAIAAGVPGDNVLETPAIEVAGDESFVLSFDYRHDFLSAEVGGVTLYTDGAVVEVSVDGGEYTDIIDLGIDPGYAGTILGNDQFPNGNPLGDRQALVGQSAGYPALANLELDFGDQFAGTSIQVRFRVGTGVFGGNEGMTLDNLEVAGALNEPFVAAGDEDGVCAKPGIPVADAGADQTVAETTAVALDGTGSSDPDGDALTFAWVQVEGPAVELSDAGAASPTFTAPELDTDATLTFELTVTDGINVGASDTVTITVEDEEETTGGGGGGGPDDDNGDNDDGGCAVASAGSGASTALLWLLALVVVRRRRR